MPSSFQYPVERHRDLQRRWDRLFQRTAAANEVRKKYRRAEEDHDRRVDAMVPRARHEAAPGSMKTLASLLELCPCTRTATRRGRSFRPTRLLVLSATTRGGNGA